MNSPSQPMDLLFCGYRARGEDGTPSPNTINFNPHHNRGLYPNLSVDSAESDSEAHQP